MSEAVIKASYHTYSRVLGRKMLQMVFEVPIEQAPMVHQIMGEPQPDGSTLVAIARLQEPSAKAEKPKRSWDQIQRSQQAALMCGDPEFDGFLDKTWPSLKAMKSTADKVRHLCIVVSRADLDKDSVAADRWDKLFSDFQLWKRGAAA